MFSFSGTVLLTETTNPGNHQSQGGEASILIVEREPAARYFLLEGLRARGLVCEGVTSADEAIKRLAEGPCSLVLADMSETCDCTGMQRLRLFCKSYPDLAFIIVATPSERESAIAAVRDGAYDYVFKPYDLDEVSYCVTRALEKQRLAREIRFYRQYGVREESSREELQKLLFSIVKTITTALEARDQYTAHHSYRVAELAVRLAHQVGMEPRQVEAVRMAALLHDIGKIGIRESVLHKKGQLTPDEMEHIKTHPLVAEQILRPLKQLAPLIPSIRHEHEAYDGSGYPDGIAGEGIPLEARIIAVADAYDALTTDRPYRPALSHDEAMRIMREGAGRIWDPTLVDLFGTMFPDG